MNAWSSQCGEVGRTSVRPMGVDGLKCMPCGINTGNVLIDFASDEADFEQEAESGSRATVRLQDPSMPTKAEREEHEKKHLPYRSRCRHCVRGRGKELPHKSKQDDSNGIEMSFDSF